jgi:hypothetical protein
MPASSSISTFMAYSRSESTLKRMLPDLAPIARGRTQKWDTEPGRAWYMASRIREALYIARNVFPHRYPELAAAARSFVIEVLDDHTVQARPTSNTPATAISNGEGLTETETPTHDVTPTHGLELALSVPRTIVGQRTATDIISWWLRAQPTNDKLVFTEVQLDDHELDMLAQWASSRTPRWMIVVNRAEGIVTLSPFQPGIPAWGVRRGV